MSERMRTIPFGSLLGHIVGEYLKSGSIFNIPYYTFFRKENRKRVRIFDRFIDTPVGPAAGPHTQLVQNIVVSYLSGGRFIELKTVQKLDSLEIEKPCIDARDEGYNTEWSTELSLEEAYSEYVKGWVILHLFEVILGFKVEKEGGETPSFLFNMSIGYDLEGIKTERMNRFIDGLIDAGSYGENLLGRYIEEVEKFAKTPLFREFLEEVVRREGEFNRKLSVDKILDTLKEFSSYVSPRIAESVTLSTMHGCPPEEIELICNYLIEEKRIDTYVKLNPTLLGYRRVREILDTNGYDYIELKEESFSHDLKYEDAVGIVGRLIKRAEASNLHFGVKLSNTLGTVNPGRYLPGNEMYMSGRALFPLTIHLASMLGERFNGRLAISYAGGASQLNVADIFKAGIKPITFATELLKPGGYLRLREAAEILEKLEWDDKGEGIDVKAVGRLAEDSLGNVIYQKQWRKNGRVRVNKKLPLLDCAVAPCVNACPVNQDVPEYVSLAGEKRYEEALNLIYSRNMLPNITGYICEQGCAEVCTRLDYDSPVLIRDVKLVATLEAELKRKVRSNLDTLGDRWVVTESRPNLRVAVIGAGPAGLACAFYLGLAGVDVTVFDKNQSAGGIVEGIIPRYRIKREAILRDIKVVESLGVHFVFGKEITSTESKKIRDEYDFVFIGIGAEVPRGLSLKIKGLSKLSSRVIDALSFLKEFNSAIESGARLDLGEKVAVIGGGNTAMDAARAALRCPGVREVNVYYRRTEREMPASREEYLEVMNEGGRFNFLLNPVSIESGWLEREGLRLKLERMELGEPDNSGRRRPIGTGEYLEVEVDSVIYAIGEVPETSILTSFGVRLDRSGKPIVDTATLEADDGVYVGGDALRGPASIVEAVSDGRRAADSILKNIGVTLETLPLEVERKNLILEIFSEGDESEAEGKIRDIYMKKGKVYGPDEIVSLNASGENDVEGGGNILEQLAEREANRCLGCDFVCNKCVDVCPNRANVPIRVRGGGLKNYYQILHIDSFCNECGNCATFCPWDGKPYKDKFTLYHKLEDFNSDTNNGFIILDVDGKRKVRVRLGDKVEEYYLSNDGRIEDKFEAKGIKIFIESVVSDYGYLLEDG